MKLPNSDKAWIPERKLIDYILSMIHPVGKAKAKFFRSYGFHDDNVDLLERGLLGIARSQDVAQATSSDHGTKFVVDGLLETPSDQTVRIRTVWIIESDDGAPRFLTAYPG